MTKLSRTILAIAAASISATAMTSTVASADVVCAEVTNSKNDAEEEFVSGRVTNSSHDLDLEPSQVIGLRFTNLPIPQGATITYAYISMVAESSDSDYTWLRIFGEDHNSAKNFDNDDDEITDRPETDAYADWVPTSWTTGNRYFSSLITGVVQEIVDRSGWDSGNDLALIIHTYAGEREAYSFDGRSTNAPELCVSYN